MEYVKRIMTHTVWDLCTHTGDYAEVCHVASFDEAKKIARFLTADFKNAFAGNAVTELGSKKVLCWYDYTSGRTRFYSKPDDLFTLGEY